MKRVFLDNITRADTAQGCFKVADYLSCKYESNEVGAITISNTRDIEFDFSGVDFVSDESLNNQPLVFIHTSRSCVVSNVKYVRDYSLWDQKEWINARDGIALRGIDCHSLDTHLEGVRHGVFALVENAQSIATFIQGFSGDGLRGCASFTQLKNFSISDHYAGDERLHGDGVQIHPFLPPNQQAGSLPLESVVVQNGYIRNIREKAGMKWLQGITQTDGSLKKPIFQNLTIQTDHELAMLLASCDSAELDNIVVHDLPLKSPRIQIGSNKPVYRNNKNTFRLRGVEAPEVVLL